jgi:hypothetical protein
LEPKEVKGLKDYLEYKVPKALKVHREGKVSKVSVEVLREF